MLTLQYAERYSRTRQIEENSGLGYMYNIRIRTRIIHSYIHREIA